MARTDKIVQQMRTTPGSVRYADLERVCVEHFGQPRRSGSHVIFSAPWQGAPMVNIQPGSDGKSAKPYQVRQVLAAIDKLRGQNG